MTLSLLCCVQRLALNPCTKLGASLPEAPGLLSLPQAAGDLSVVWWDIGPCPPNCPTQLPWVSQAAEPLAATLSQPGSSGAGSGPHLGLSVFRDWPKATPIGSPTQDLRPSTSQRQAGGRCFQAPSKEAPEGSHPLLRRGVDGGWAVAGRGLLSPQVQNRVTAWRWQASGETEGSPGWQPLPLSRELPPTKALLAGYQRGWGLLERGAGV